MSLVAFSSLDAAILFSIPQPGVALEELLWYYTSTTRAGPPSFDSFSECMSKAIQAGIVTISSNLVCQLSDAWYFAVHQFDATSEHEIEAMNRFDQYLTSRTWPTVSTTNYKVPLALYQRAVGRARPW
jgi:hypothetical protein